MSTTDQDKSTTNMIQSTISTTSTIEVSKSTPTDQKNDDMFKQPRKTYDVINQEWNKSMEDQLDKQKKGLLAKFTKSLKNDFPHEVQSSALLIRFLRARKWNLEASEKMFRNRMKWVKEFKPHSIGLDEVKQVLVNTNAHWYGKDKCGRPILCLQPGIQTNANIEFKALWRGIIYMMELGMSKLPPPPHNQYCIIYDLKGFNPISFDVNLFKHYAKLGDIYPETLHAIYILNSKWVYNAMFGVVRRLMDPVTNQKVKLVKNDKLMQVLSTDIPVHNIHPLYGGTGQFDLFYPDFSKISKKLKKQVTNKEEEVKIH